MTEDEALAIHRAVAAMSPWADTPQKVAIWVGILTSPQQADVEAEDAAHAVVDLLAEIDPKHVTPALVLQKARSYARARAPSTVVQLEERYRLEAPAKRRQQLTFHDREALARLAKAFADRGEMKAFDHILGTLKSCGVEWSSDEEIDVPF